MNIFDSLKGHKVVEANNLTGLRNGHMVAQTAFDNSTAAKEDLDNGFILEINDKGLLALTNATKGAFLHYSEEHMKFLDNAPLEMFTVTLDKTDAAKSYPRAIALYEGDTFTTDNFTGKAPAADEVKGITVVEGLLTVGEVVAGQPIATLSALPNGKEAIQVVWRNGGGR